MTIDDQNLTALWYKRYGYTKWIRDCYGYWIYLDDHGNNCSKRITPDGRLEDCGWEIDHIYPQSYGGGNDETNLEFTYHCVNEAKSNNLNYSFNGKSYSVRKRPYKYGYGIVNLSTYMFIDYTSKH